VRSTRDYCSADGNVNYYTYCSSYWDESGYTAVLPVGSHTITASISTAQDQFAAFTTTWTVLVTGSVVSNPQVVIYNFSAKDGYGNSGYASNGNLLNYSDTLTGSWTMGYDAVNRLHTGVAANGPYNGASITWDYDSFGNRLDQNVTGNSNVPTAWAMYYPSNKLSTNQLAPNPNTLGYDASGNMTFDGTNNVIYDGEGRVCAVAVYNYATQSTLITQYLFDAEGNRIAKGHPIGNSSTPSCPTGPGDFQPDEKYILGQNGEQLTQLDGSDNWQHTNVWVGSQVLATYDNQSTIVNGQTVAQPLHFNVTDPLGTKRLQVSADGTPELTCISLPFGEGPDCSGTEATRHRFTGKERDTESGLDYFGARHYSSSMGRWMSPDWADKPEAVPYSDLTDPQSLNLYGYVNNNPLSHTDADGHCCESDFNSFTEHPGRIRGGQTAYDRQFTSTLASSTKAVLGIAAVAYAGPEVLAEAGMARTLGQSTIVAVKAVGVAGAGVNAAADTMGAVTGKDVDTGTNHVTSVTNPVAVAVSAIFGSATTGSNANDAATTGKAIAAAASGKNVSNPAEALGSIGGAVDALRSTAKAIGSYVTGPPGPGAPPAPKTPGCSVAGAC
jgi:RHS repeat-associated protein